MTHATPAELSTLTALCLRAKAHWGYCADFMTACADELTVHATDLSDLCAVIRDQDRFVGIVQVAAHPNSSLGMPPLPAPKMVLEMLFVEPKDMGQGYGRALFDWAVTAARQHGARTMDIASDPNALAFYQHLGAKQIGVIPSGSISGRELPLLSVRL